MGAARDAEEAITGGLEHASSVISDVGSDLGIDRPTDVWNDLTGKTQADAEKKARRISAAAALKGEALQKHRYQQAEDRLSPWMESESEALAAYRGELGLGPETGGSSAYMETPGYQAMMDESLQAAEQSAVSSGATAYGGRRLQEAGKVGAGVQQSYYQNYMNMLGEAANPSTSTNVSNLGLGHAAQMRAAGERDAATQGKYITSQAKAGVEGTEGLATMATDFLEGFI